MKALLVAATILALPVSAQQDPFDVTLHCQGELPMFITIDAVAPGTITLSLVDMMQACVNALPQKSRWRSGA